MQTATEERVVAKPKGRPKSSVRNDVTVKADAGIIRKAKFAADARGLSLAEYISELLRGPVERDFAKAIKQAEGGEA